MRKLNHIIIFCLLAAMFSSCAIPKSATVIKIEYRYLDPHLKALSKEYFNDKL